MIYRFIIRVRMPSEELWYDNPIEDSCAECETTLFPLKERACTTAKCRNAEMACARCWSVQCTAEGQVEQSWCPPCMEKSLQATSMVVESRQLAQRRMFMLQFHAEVDVAEQSRCGPCGRGVCILKHHLEIQERGSDAYILEAVQSFEVGSSSSSSSCT